VENDVHYMNRALELAEFGRGHTSPNPLVGAVLVKDGRIIGEGYHQKYGEAHAEINALNSAGSEAEGSTLYVTLEPCSHHGKTPPCCLAVAKAKVKKVVCALKDPNPLVNGRGLAYLKSLGIQTSCGLLETEAEKQNEIFLHYIQEKTPFVTLKSAMSFDGKIATKTGESQWITCEESRRYSHHLRSTHSAIMVGVGTVLADDPLLTTRSDKEGKNPIRIVMDSSGRTPLSARLFQTIDQADLILICSDVLSTEKEKSYLAAGAKVIRIAQAELAQRIKATLKELGKLGIDSVLVEGGGILADSFVRSNSVQKYHLFMAPLIIGGRDALTTVEGEGFEQLENVLRFDIANVEKLGTDLHIEAYPKRRPQCSQV